MIQVLTRDHREVEEMFSEFSTATQHDRLRRIADDVTIELVRHSVAEEIHLYPAFRRHVPGGYALADTEIADHAEVERVLKELERADSSLASFMTLVRRLIDDVRAHIADEESFLFPRLAEHTTSQQRMELGDKVRAAKRTAPTRPHPASPNKPPLNRVLAPGAGLVDRARDHLTGCGRG